MEEGIINVGWTNEGQADWLTADVTLLHGAFFLWSEIGLLERSGEGNPTDLLAHSPGTDFCFLSVQVDLMLPVTLSY